MNSNQYHYAHTIWKFPIEITDRQTVLMPGESSVLSAGLDPAGEPCLWALVKPGAPEAQVAVRVVGTGHPIDKIPYRYVGSFVDGHCVWHVFIE